MSGNQTFEWHGYFETLSDPDTAAILGNRKLEKIPDQRKLGIEGTILVMIHESFDYQRGHKSLRFNVKPGEIHTFRSTIYPLCGRMIEKAGN